MTLLNIDWSETSRVVILGISMVFVILVLLIFVIKFLGMLFAPKVLLKKKSQKNAINEPEPKEEEYEESHLTAECSAAIGMALHLYYEDVHDLESTIVTIKRVEKRYSPWNSKIYGLTNLVR